MTYTSPGIATLMKTKGSLLTKLNAELVKIANELVLGTSSVSGAEAAVADGATVTHGLGTTPSAVFLTGSVAADILSVAAIGATTFTVAIKTPLGASGTTQTVYWLAVKAP